MGYFMNFYYKICNQTLRDKRKQLYQLLYNNFNSPQALNLNNYMIEKMGIN